MPEFECSWEFESIVLDLSGVRLADLWEADNPVLVQAVREALLDVPAENDILAGFNNQVALPGEPAGRTEPVE